jgi:Protein of Unknown function (DUF2784)
LLRAPRADNRDVNGWRIAAEILADIVLIFHAAYVAFVVLGLAAIVVGWALGWRWVRNTWFRGLHLVAIGLVFAESIMGIACPLTVFENWLRWHAGEQGYSTDFLAYWVHQLIFHDWPPWIFLSLYAGVTILVAAMYRLVPPEPRRRKLASAQAGKQSASDARLP